METIFMNTANSKTKHSNKFVYNFTDKLNLKKIIKHCIRKFKYLLHMEKY